MPQKVKGPRFQELGAPKSVAFLGFVLLVGVVGMLLLPLAWQGFSGAAFALGFLLAATLLFAYAFLVLIPALLSFVEPTPFPLHNGTEKKVKKFRVKANCKDGSTKPVITADFTIPPYGEPMYLAPGDTAPLQIDGEVCDPNSIVVTVTIVDEGVVGNERVVTTDEIPFESHGATACNIVITEDMSTTPSTIWVHIFCDGQPPVDVRAECH